MDAWQSTSRVRGDGASSSRACGATVHTAPRGGRLTSASAGACRNALTVGDPLCQHGGLLHDSDAREPTSCSFCDCPAPGWGGVTCESASTGPAASQRESPVSVRAAA